MNRTVPPTGVLLVIGSCISLQFGAALATQLFPHAGAFGTTFFRLFIAGLIMVAVTRPRVREWDRAQWKAIILFGFSIGLMNSFFYAGIARIPLGTAVTIEFLGPLLLAAFLSRSARDFLWVALAMAGMALLGVESLTGITSLDPLGVLFTLIAGVFWVCYILTSARLGQAVPGAGGLAVGMLIGSLAPLPLGITQAPAVLTEPQFLLLAVGTAILASIVPYTFEFFALRQIPKGVFGILLSLEPAFAALFGWLLLSQPMTILGTVAIVFVIAASIGTTSTANKQARAARKKQRKRSRGQTAADDIIIDQENTVTQGASGVQEAVEAIDDNTKAPHSGA